MSKANKLHRLTSAMNILTQNEGVSAKEIAASLQICERTAYRYLRVLKELGYPVRPSSDPEAEKRKYLLTPISFTGPEALALAAASQSLLNQAGLAMSRQLQSALLKVESVIRSGEDTYAYRRLKPHFTYLSEELRDYSPWQEMIATLTDCVRRSRSVTAVYDSYSSGKVTERILDPYHLFWGEGNLYLAAHCHLRNQVCNFRLDRFISVKAQNNLFTRNPSFNLEDYLGPSFRVWSGTEEVSVRFLVYPPASRFFRESCYHRSQQVQDLDDGQIVCTLTVYNSPELKSWLLSWGKQVEVLEPQALREEIKEELQAGLGRYV
ncbi:MAG: transcriptional regulator [Dethiobacter sp.]|nr:transcriptional regulator [Dethiobacter sp.]